MPLPKPIRILVMFLGVAIVISLMACGAFVFFGSVREGFRDTTWTDGRKFIAILLYLATGVTIVARTASNIKKKYNVDGDMQFVILLAYIVALAIWGIACFLPIYLLLGRS